MTLGMLLDILSTVYYVQVWMIVSHAICVYALEWLIVVVGQLTKDIPVQYHYDHSDTAPEYPCAKLR